MHITRLLLLFPSSLTIGLALAQSVQFGASSEDADEVPLIRILAEPDSYDGLLVRTQGYATFGFETTGLFVRRELWGSDRDGKALWLAITIPDLSLLDLEPLDGELVSIEGRVHANDKGHRGMYTAGLQVDFIASLRGGSYRKTDLDDRPGFPSCPGSPTGQTTSIAPL